MTKPPTKSSSGLLSERTPDLVGAIVSDLIGAFVPGAGLAGLTVKALLRKRLEDARDILLGEIRRGEKTLFDPSVEDVVAILYRYARAAQEGAARTNLKMMARVIAGQAACGNLVADEFLYYADILDSLRREEIILIAVFYKHWKLETYAKTETPGASALKHCKDELVPNLFRSDTDMKAAINAILRTGLLVVESGFGMLVYSPSRLLEQLHQMALFEAASYGEGAL
jgi:hypothetical protein